METLVDHLAPYSRTKTFTRDTVPEKLLNNHNTKKGTWGIFTVEQGEIEYIIEEDETIILSKDQPGIIEPTILRRIRPLGEVSFYIEFYK